MLSRRFWGLTPSFRGRLAAMAAMAVVWTGAACLLAGLLSSEAAASLAFSTPSNSSDTDGPVSASAHFQILNNGELTVTLTNTEVRIGSIGQAISEFYFTWNGPGSITALSTVSGTPVDVSNNGTYSLLAPVSTSSPSRDVHWGFGASGGAIAIETVANGGNDNVAPGGKPNYLIVGAPGSDNHYGQGSPSLDQHNPSFYESATFVFADSALTTGTLLTGTDVTKVSFGFGTGPEANIGGTLTSVTAPEPSTFLLMAMALPGLLVVSRRHRKAASVCKDGC